MAWVVSSSHFPLGIPENDPSFARAAWISLTRSLLGAFCPGCRREWRLDFPAARELPLRTEDLAPLPAVFWPAGEALAVVVLGEEAFRELWLTGFEAALGVALDAVGDFFFAALFDCAKPAGTPDPTALSSRIRSAG
jgi:hypothetical protein